MSVVSGLNPNMFETLNTADLLARAAELQNIDPQTATLLRWSALEIDSLRDASLEAHGVTIVDGSRCAGDPAAGTSVAVTIIEPHSDPVYGSTFRLPAFITKGSRA